MLYIEYGDILPEKHPSKSRWNTQLNQSMFVLISMHDKILARLHDKITKLKNTIPFNIDLLQCEIWAH